MVMGDVGPRLPWRWGARSRATMAMGGQGDHGDGKHRNGVTMVTGGAGPGLPWQRVR